MGCICLRPTVSDPGVVLLLRTIDSLLYVLVKIGRKSAKLAQSSDTADSAELQHTKDTLNPPGLLCQLHMLGFFLLDTHQRDLFPY